MTSLDSNVSAANGPTKILKDWESAMTTTSRSELYTFIHDRTFETSGAGLYWFRALVIFNAEKRRGRAETKVTAMLAGYDDGIVDVFAAGQLTAEEFHLSFKPDFQKYEYDRGAGSLKIHGQSEKMGKYLVEIIPLP
jgi:hypothetical protein